MKRAGTSTQSLLVFDDGAELLTGGLGCPAGPRDNALHQCKIARREPSGRELRGSGARADRSISAIQRALAKAGASAILMDFDNSSNIVALSFRLGYQLQITFRLAGRPVTIRGATCRAMI